MFEKNIKQTIISGLILVFLAIGAFFMVNVELPPWSHYLSAFNVLLFALPSFWAVRRWLGWRDGAILVAVLGTYALLIEASAILTGFPYGHFGYSDLLGYRILGLVPWTVAFAWTPLILGAHAVAATFAENIPLRVIATTLIVTLFDVVLDPGAILLGFWQYDGGGWFYGVPLSNFAGWLASGFIGASIIEILRGRFKPFLPTPVQLASSAIFIIFFWAAIAKHGGLVAPAVIGFATFVGLVIFYARNHYAFDDKIVFVDEDNNPIGTGDKLQSHNENTELHRAFSVFLFNSQGEFLMQQRALSKKTWPGVWSNSCCGHVMLHESPQAAANRRIKYELGMTGIDLTLALPHFRYRAEKSGVVENEICPVFIGFTDSEPRPNRDEVEATKWVRWDEFVRSLDDPDTDISPWAVKEVRELVRSDVFKKQYLLQTRNSG
ncbi:MAG TPA: isopentenyl-diphosphate Delta-isomerase [Pyrinomonadaceae bacterium]